MSDARGGTQHGLPTTGRRAIWLVSALLVFRNGRWGSCGEGGSGRDQLGDPAILSHEDELSGYDVRKVTEWSIRYFYWSPSFSQIYSELRKLEKIGLVTSRVDHDNGARSRRLYKITAAGLEAVTRWANDTPAEPPMLKHSVLLRVAFGHLAGAGKLKQLLQ